MIRSKIALISSFVILVICMYLYFPFPNNVLVEARSTFMSFPIQNQDGYVSLGIIGSVLFIVAIILLVMGIKKYRLRAIIIVVLVYAFLPHFLIMMYQETLANGISAISYDDGGECNFESVGEGLLNAECDFVLHNRSNKEVSFELEFLDSFSGEDKMRMGTLMNLVGPYSITIEAKHKKSIHLKELLKVKDIPKHIEGGTYKSVHFKLNDGKTTRIL